MAKTKRYTNFREFYEDAGNPRGKPNSESKRDQNLNKYKYMNPKDLDDNDNDDEYFDDTDIANS